MQLEFTENAQRSIDDFDDKIKRFVVKKLRYLTDNYIQIVATKQVQKLANSKVSRFKISDDIRAFFITFYEKQDGTIDTFSLLVVNFLYLYRLNRYLLHLP